MVTRRLSAEQPLASSPMVARGRHSPCREVDTVCQRLSLDSPIGCGLLLENRTDAQRRQPFSVMYLAPSTPDQSKPQLTLALPSLQDDYSCLTRSSSVSWSRDGCILGIGNKEGDVQLWDVEKRTRLRTITSHLSGVGALSWNQHVLSSGSVLGLIHHHDYRLDTPTVGVFQQQGAVCGLEWAPQGDWLASGSIDGLLNIWTNDLGSKTKTHPPARTMTQPSAVKAMAWCPWQKELIATGGGQSDGVLRIWNNQSGTCVDSAQTNSQVCSVVWSEERKALFTGHGLPHHHITCWSPSPSLEETYQLHGHMGRVLHLALSPNGTKLLSAGADCLGHVWNT
ncbi:cell division cycle protein 20 homolog B [Oncorhynchus kisutch]|uniref:cell division cycle protein 20 homolog B n=1 Tax=Oncorhynchus kisutch TaxID=8019 RepID=UPI0012DFCD3C|nr:cell division cycle protein 20 homolog B [Oncorhynchus kisutch]